MKKKMTFNQILDLVFWSIIIILTFIELYNGGLKDINISDLKNINFQNITLSKSITYILGILFFIFVAIIGNMIRVFYLTVIYFGIKIANKKHRKDKLEKIDFKNDDYYRDILPKYSPAVLSYLDDFKINKKDVVATLLMLELKGKIKIEQENIILLNDSTDALEGNELYILNKVKEKTLKDINLLEYSNIVKKDALKKGLLQEKGDIKRSIKKKIIINVIIYLFIILCFRMLPNYFTIDNNIMKFLVLIVLIVNFFLLVFMPYITIIYINHYRTLSIVDPYVRNDEGKIINTKLEGLRKFLIDFSKIEDKTKEQLILWEDYLIYSVILGINTKLVDEVYSKIN